MYQTSDIRKGLKVEIDGAPWIIVDFQFVKPGKGQAFTRTRIKNLITGNTIERTFKTGEELGEADIEEYNAQYLYADGEDYQFMNLETFEQFAISGKVIGSGTQFLVDQMEVHVMTYKGRPVSVELPNFVELEITYCEPGMKGATVTGGSKPATLSTGAQVAVPLFMQAGEWIRVDTRDGSYVERVKK